MTKVLVAVSALMICIPAGVHAQTHTTYTTTGAESVTVGTQAPGSGRMIQGGMQKGKSVSTHADGSKVEETWTCISTTQPPNAKIFDVHSLCDISNARGTYTITFGCQIMDENGAMGCLGGLYGKTGWYEGKGGGTTWMGLNGSGTGTAQWSD